MGSDDDIAASLPRPPLPAPARREAAIEEALRRFDGGGALPPAPTGRGHPQRSPPWRIWLDRPYAGALAGAFLVALIALPIAWMSLGGPSTDQGRHRSPGAVGEAAPGPAIAAADANPSPATGRPPPLAGSDAAPPREAPAATPAPAPTELALAVPPPAPPPPAVTADGPAADGREDRPDPAALASSNLAVTGSRISRSATAEPVAPAAEAEDRSIVVTSARTSSARSAGRGDWNACTVDDPSRSLSRCRKLADPAAKGAAGRAAARMAEGLSLAWQGDFEDAIAAFGQAIEAAPRSSFAYLNRGLAYRRAGDLDRALADLDRAVRYAPRAARGYYNRSLLLRERGDMKRARADEERAVDLDRRYADLAE
jgi:tetratricopeptide (TPR) repeat protein